MAASAAPPTQVQQLRDRSAELASMRRELDELPDRIVQDHLAAAGLFRTTPTEEPAT